MRRPFALLALVGCSATPPPAPLAPRAAAVVPVTPAVVRAPPEPPQVVRRPRSPAGLPDARRPNVSPPLE